MPAQALAAYYITHKLKDELANYCVRTVDNFIQNCAHSKSTVTHTSTRQGSQQV
jgi:hypothetical protein